MTFGASRPLLESSILSIFIVCVSSLKLLIYPFSETCCAQLTCTKRARETLPRARVHVPATMSAIASLTAPVAVKAGKSAAFSRGTRVSQVRAHADSRTPRGLDRTRRENLIRDRARAEERRPRDRPERRRPRRSPRVPFTTRPLARRDPD